MKMIVPSVHQAITFHMNFELLIDGSRVELQRSYPFDFPTTALNEQSRVYWELATRQTMAEFVNVWLDTVFANIVAEKP